MKLTIPKELNRENLEEQEQDCLNRLAQEKRFAIIVNGKTKVSPVDFANLKPEEKEGLKAKTKEIIEQLDINESKDIVEFVFYHGNSKNNDRIELRNFGNSQSANGMAGFGGVEHYVKENNEKLLLQFAKEKQEMMHKHALDKLETKIGVLESNLSDAEEEIGQLREKLEGTAPMEFISNNKELIGAGLGMLKDFLPKAMGAGLGNVPSATLVQEDILADFQGSEKEQVLFFINHFKKDRNFLEYLYTHYTTQTEQTEEQHEQGTTEDSE
jgi:hypothetical protein